MTEAGESTNSASYPSGSSLSGSSLSGSSLSGSSLSGSSLSGRSLSGSLEPGDGPAGGFQPASGHSGIFVAVAGNIGAGKSSLTRVLSTRYHLAPVYEAVDENPYLEDFYADMPRYAFHSQIFFLAARLKQHLREVNPGRRVIQDRTVYEDAAIFARLLHDDGIMDDRDHASYRTLYHAVSAALRPPDLLIYLRASLPTLKRHIAQRGRSYEAGIEDGYLERLGELYEQWIDDYALSPVVVVPGDDLDFVNHEPDLRRVLDLLERHGLTAPVVG